ncbi:hypothetical protein [Burkholderia cepacia]|nr:hypothetical protein [Burkholderia cepacia]
MPLTDHAAKTGESLAEIESVRFAAQENGDATHGGAANEARFPQARAVH